MADLQPKVNILKNSLPLWRATIVAWLMIASIAGAQELPAVTDEMLGRTGAVLHVDVQTGRLAGVTSSGPIAEIGAKIMDVLFGDYAAGEWMAYSKRVEGEYVKPAVSQRLLLLRRDGDGGVLLDEEYSPAKRDALVGRFTEYRRKSELLTGSMHVPDYLLRSTNNALLHVEIQKSVPFDRGRGNLSATHTATVRAVAQGELKPGQSIEFIEEGRRRKRFDPPASRERIVLLSYSRSTQDGQMKWWLHDRVNYGYSEAGFVTLKADTARVRAAQAEKAARDASK
ncbi:MAG: hypothetical protein ABL891_23580 [Burkholderiales bacterium]